MARKKIKKISEVGCKPGEGINELIDRVNTIDKDIVAIGKKQNMMIDKYNEMAVQVNVCKKLLQEIIDAIPKGKDKPKDIVVPGRE